MEPCPSEESLAKDITLRNQHLIRICSKMVDNEEKWIGFSDKNVAVEFPSFKTEGKGSQEVYIAAYTPM